MQTIVKSPHIRGTKIQMEVEYRTIYKVRKPSNSACTETFRKFMFQSFYSADFPDNYDSVLNNLN
jgi:hypothetical protein